MINLVVLRPFCGAREVFMNVKIAALRIRGKRCAQIGLVGRGTGIGRMW